MFIRPMNALSLAFSSGEGGPSQRWMRRASLGKLDLLIRHNAIYINEPSVSCVVPPSPLEKADILSIDLCETSVV